MFKLVSIIAKYEQEGGNEGECIFLLNCPSCETRYNAIAPLEAIGHGEELECPICSENCNEVLECNVVSQE